MKTLIHIFYFLFFIFCVLSFTTFISGCAQIGAPTGGAKDTIPPKLLSASPKLLSTNISSNKITLTFDEYVDVQDPQSNVLVSPFPKKNPTVDFKLKTVTVKLKDTLLPNTTYSIDFGSSIRDNNEGNVFKDFMYVFSTGNSIDSFEIKGKVLMAETGKADSTLIIMLYRNANDSSVQKRKPDYISKVKGDGSFDLSYLPAEKFKIFALKDGDGSKTYNSPSEVFAFADSDIVVKKNIYPVSLYAYVQEKETEKKKNTGTEKNTKEKKLKYSASTSGSNQDLLSDLVIEFSNPLKKFKDDKIILTDTTYKIIQGSSYSLDSTQRRIIVKTKWHADSYYKLIIDKDVAADSLGNQIVKTDTISFKTKNESEYGSILIRFTNLSVAKHPVIQFVQGENIIRSVPVMSAEWSDKLFPPGEYELRILYDDNNNGKWDPGNYSKKLQPEKTITLDKKINIRADWENEREIQL